MVLSFRYDEWVFGDFLENDPVAGWVFWAFRRGKFPPQKGKKLSLKARFSEIFCPVYQIFLSKRSHEGFMGKFVVLSGGEISLLFPSSCLFSRQTTVWMTFFGLNQTHKWPAVKQKATYALGLFRGKKVGSFCLFFLWNQQVAFRGCVSFFQAHLSKKFIVFSITDLALYKQKKVLNSYIRLKNRRLMEEKPAKSVA